MAQLKWILLRTYSVNCHFSLTQKEAEAEPDFDLEEILEPRMEISSGKMVDKHEELQYVKDHKNIPEHLKPKLLEFLNKTQNYSVVTNFQQNIFLLIFMNMMLSLFHPLLS